MGYSALKWELWIRPTRLPSGAWTTAPPGMRVSSVQSRVSSTRSREFVQRYDLWATKVVGSQVLVDALVSDSEIEAIRLPWTTT